MNLVGTAGREDQGARRRVKRRERKAGGQMGTVGKKQRGEREWGGGEGERVEGEEEEEGGGRKKRRTRRKARRRWRRVTGASAVAALGRHDCRGGCAPERDFTTNPVCKLLFIFRKVCQTWALIFRPDFPLVARSRTRSHIIYDCLWS